MINTRRIARSSCINAFLCGIFLSGIAGEALAGGYTGWRKIDHMFAEAGHAYIYAAGSDFDNPENCDQSEKIYLANTTTSYQEILSMLLTVFAGDFEFRSWTSSCFTTQWGYTVPEIKHVDIRRAPS